MVKIAAACLILLGAACASFDMSPTLVPTLTAPESLPVTHAVPETPPQADGFSQMDAYREGRYRISANFTVSDIEGGDFQLGQVKEEWQDAWRYELDFLYHFGMYKKHVEPIAGAYVFWEDREWSAGGIADIDYESIGFGIETAANLFAFEGGERAKFNMGLLPYARIGVGFQGGTFTNIPSDVGFSTGSFDGYKGEITIGMDAHVMILRKLRLALGGGFSWWSSTDQSATTRDTPGGSIVDRYDNINFRGNDLFIRASVGFKF